MAQRATSAFPRREFLQLADTFNPDKHQIAGWFVSEKLDGTRCFWDGGITRGCRTEDVPWASVTDPKTGERKGKIKPRSTGLWSRYGNPIMAPDWWLNQLPQIPLDGELWAGRGNFQLCRSICGGDDPDPRFDVIRYAVYSTPALPYIFGTGEIKNANMVCTLDYTLVQKWLATRQDQFPDLFILTTPCTFNNELMCLREHLEAESDRVFLHRQVKLPDDEQAARDFANKFVEQVLDQGGEGCVLRNPEAVWTPKRHKGLLKFKPYEDAEAKIIGFRAGKEGKQGNVLGKIGTLIVETVSFENNVQFEIGSGLTMDQRELLDRESIIWAEFNPGDRMPEPVKSSKHFSIGDIITFKYRELSDDGIPKEGRFWRKRDME